MTQGHFAAQAHRVGSVRVRVGPRHARAAAQRRASDRARLVRQPLEARGEAGPATLGSPGLGREVRVGLVQPDSAHQLRLYGDALVRGIQVLGNRNRVLAVRVLRAEIARHAEHGGWRRREDGSGDQLTEHGRFFESVLS